MFRSFRIYGILIALLASVGRAHGAAEVVVSIRYLQPKGVSHAHLYLYREDGRLLRQLTDDNSGQDVRPVFSPDGETIVFTRPMARDQRQYWSIRPRGGDLRRLAAAPAWYTAARSAPYFTNIEAPAPAAPTGPAPGPSSPTPRYRAPDGSVELVLRTVESDQDDSYDGPGHGKHYLLRDLKSGTETEMGRLPGFEGLYDLLHVRQDPGKHFLLDSGLRLAFYGLHLNSTDGDTTYALDLSRRRLVRLSPNWATVFPLPGEPAFLTLTSVRYVPITGSRMTANCNYLERWDAALNRVRFARKGAARCYGASMYRPGRTPAVISVLSEGE